MKSKIGKVIKAIVTGSLLMGATLGGAFAAPDLKDFPNQYIKDGKFNGVLIIGDKAAAEDVIGLSDIAVALQFAAVQQTEDVNKKLVEVSDAWKVGTSTKMLEISENLDSGSVNSEAIASVISGSYISEPELSILANGEARNNKGVSPYRQRLYFNDTETGYVVYTESDDDVTDDFLYFKSGKDFARYELEFTTSLESDVDDATGSSDTTGLFLTDFEDVDVTMFGKKYTIVQAKRLTTSGNDVSLILMGGAMKDTLTEKQTKLYTIKGVDYEVTLNYVDDDEAQFTVNGQITRKLKDGDTDKLSDGTIVGVTDILYQNYAGGIHSATFFLGANKIELKDTDVTDDSSSNSLKVDDRTIDDADVVIEATDNNSTFKINRMNVVMKADDEVYIPSGGMLSNNPNLDKPEILFTENWDIEYAGLTKELSNNIKVRTTGSDQYKLEFVDWSGNKVNVPFVNAVDSSTVRLGDDDDDLIINESKVISKDDYFAVTDISEARGERPTYVLRYRGADKETADNKIMKFDDVGTGERIEVPYSGQGNADPLATLKIGGGSYPIRANPPNESTTDVGNFNITVDMNQDGFATNGMVSLTTNYGAEIKIVDGTPGTVNVSISTPNDNHFDSVTPTPLNFTIKADIDGDVDMSKNSGGIKFYTPEDEDDVAYGYTSYGAFVKFESPTSGEESLEIVYPRHQVTPQVYIKRMGSKVDGSLTLEDAAKEIVLKKIEVGAAKLASEVANPKDQNLILVGGPCANAVTATLLGNPADCTEGFEPGVGRIELFEHAPGKVAMLVAGYGALDTRNAATVIAEYKNYKGLLIGEKVTVKKVNTQVTVTTQ